jgi:hypothetical protein
VGGLAEETKLSVQPFPPRPTTTLVTILPAGATLVLGGAAAYFLSRAGPEALAVTSKALVTTALVGLLIMALVAIRLSNHHRGGHGRGGEQPPEPGPAPPMDDFDAELFRMIDEERLRHSSAPW